ncbi:MAG: hypothetical protein KGN02_06005 [bacterium]|nr:hypothetical protein [bacterium]
MPDRLYSLLADLFGTDIATIEQQSRAPETSWPGMRRLLIASMIESEYGIELEESDVDHLLSPTAVANVLANHGIVES